MSVHHLPVELIARIFVLGAGYDRCDPDAPFLLRPEDDYYALPSSDFQLIVSHICQRWRTIALRTSSLWTSLHFREPAHLARAEAYLARSASSPHAFDILVDTVASEEHIPGVTLSADEFHPVFNIITPYVRRWRALHLRVRDNACKHAARERLSTCGPAPRLETLQLYHFEDFRTVQSLHRATYRPPVRVFADEVPALRNVSLIGVNLRWDETTILVDLHRLELALHPDTIRPSYARWERILRASPSLVALSLHYSGPRASIPPSPWPTHDRIALPALTELSITDLDPDYLAALAVRLVAPALHTLRLDLPDQDFTTFVTHLAAGAGPLPRPAGLAALRVTALSCSAASWAALLAALPGLRALDVDFARVGSGGGAADAFLRALVGGDGAAGQCALPALADVRVAGLRGAQMRNWLAVREGFGCARARWVVRGAKGDAVLASLAARGCVLLEEQADDDDDEEEETDTESVGETVVGAEAVDLAEPGDTVSADECTVVGSGHGEREIREK